MKLLTSVQTAARNSLTKPPTSVRTAARSKTRRRPTRNRHNCPMKNHPVVAPKDLLADQKVLPVDQAGRLVGQKVLLVGLKDPLVDQADHPAKRGFDSRRTCALLSRPTVFKGAYCLSLKVSENRFLGQENRQANRGSRKAPHLVL